MRNENVSLQSGFKTASQDMVPAMHVNDMNDITHILSMEYARSPDLKRVGGRGH